jgi:hypothetical protein
MVDEVLTNFTFYDRLIFGINAEMAELVDAADLKSAG